MKSVRGVLFLLLLGASMVIAWGGSGLAASSARGEGASDAALSRDLSQALKFYYDGEYAKALPIFQRLSAAIPNADLLFWTGTSASRSGACDLALDRLKELLDRRPDHIRTRLELGIAYFNCKETENAREAFRTVIAASPGPEIENTARSYLARTERKKRKLDWSLRFSQGVQYDDNVNSGPDQALIEDGSVSLLLGDSLREQESTNWLTGLRADLLYDLGSPGGFFWNGGIDFYYNHSFEDSDYNYLRGSLFTGPWWSGKNDLIKLPFGYTHKQYGGEALSDTFRITPSYEHLFSSLFGLGVSYEFEAERYDDSRYEEAGYDNESHRFSAGPNLYFKNRQYILSARFIHEIHDADAERFTYDAQEIFGSFYALFPSDTEGLIYYKWSDRSYDGPAVLYDKDREETRHTLAAVISQNFLKHYFAALEAAYIRNDSNSALYDFDKTTITLSLGVQF